MVKGIGGQINYVKMFFDVFIDFFDIILLVRKLLGFEEKGVEVILLDGFRGFCKLGEMVLVFGKFGFGCMIFFKMIVNQCYGYMLIIGEVFYGFFVVDEFGFYCGEVVYNEEDDVYYLIFIVEQMFGFVFDVKILGKLFVGIIKQEFKDKVVIMFLKMFNIEYICKIIVGNLFICGVLGGERKCVFIVEMFIINVCIFFWDNSICGFDVFMVFDFVKFFCIQIDLYKISIFVFFYQVLENIYSFFDKVLVIDGGKQVYFGFVKDVWLYFEGFGFFFCFCQIIFDYVMGCIDVFECEYQDGCLFENVFYDFFILKVVFKFFKYVQDFE